MRRFVGVMKNGLFFISLLTARMMSSGPQKTLTQWCSARRPTGPRSWPGWAWLMGKFCQSIGLEGSVDGDVYLDVLKTIVWPAVRGMATRRSYWFQQDGASPHVTAEVMEFLRSKFGDRIISRKSQHHWPPYIPDLSPLDFSFWSQAMSHVIRVKPKTITDLKNCVEDFANNFDPQKVRSMSRHTRYRAELCVSVDGGHFEHLVKKKKKVQ